MAGAAAAKQKMAGSAPASLLLKNAARVAHGSAIFVYNHIRTNQVVYSLSKVLNNNAIKQLPYLGKKTVPPVIRKDVWKPLATIAFPSPPQGLVAYQKLREFKMLHELSYPLDLITDEKTGQLLGKKKRAKKIMDQKASAVADIAAVLKLQEEAAQAAKEEEAAIEAERQQRAAEAAKAQEEAVRIAKEKGESSDEAKQAAEKARKFAIAAQKAEAQAKVYEDAKSIQEQEDAFEAEVHETRARAEKAIADAEAAAAEIEDEHLRNKAIEAVHALNPRRVAEEAAKLERAQKAEAEKVSENAKKAKHIAKNAEKRAKTHTELSAEAEKAAAVAQEVENKSGKEAEATKEAQKAAYRAKKRQEEFQRSMERQEKLDQAARKALEEEAKQTAPPTPAKQVAPAVEKLPRTPAGAAEKARREAESILAQLYELQQARGNTDTLSNQKGAAVSKKGFKNQQIRHAQRLQREKAGIEGVKVHWANIIDAEYAENWPPVITHDVLEWNRHVIAASPVGHPAYEAAAEQLRLEDQALTSQATA